MYIIKHTETGYLTERKKKNQANGYHRTRREGGREGGSPKKQRNKGSGFCLYVQYKEIRGKEGGRKEGGVSK